MSRKFRKVSNIQFCKEHSDYFFMVLLRAIERYQVKIFAYCLMKNHYHLMLQTPEKNLDKFMQFFASRLSRGINQMIGGDGALFKGRYRALLVDDQTYVYQLFKYIHLNPVEANIVEKPEYYVLSSYRAYVLNLGEKWLDKTFMQTQFKSLEDLKSYHDGCVSEALQKLYKRKRLPTKLSLKTINGYF